MGSAQADDRGALGSGEGIGFTLFYATNFIFTGLSVAVAYHAGLFNIGSEGQAISAAWVRHSPHSRSIITFRGM